MHRKVSAPSRPCPPRPVDAATPEGSNVAIVIVNYRTPRLAMDCISSLLTEKRRMPKLRVIVVDGGSGDGSADQLSAFVRGPLYDNWVSVLPLTINGGFGWANNQAILTLAREDRPPDYIYLLNPDAHVIEGATVALADEMCRHPECAATGSMVLRPNRTVAASAFRFPSPGRELVNSADSEKLGRLLGVAPTVVRPRHSAAVDWVSGASVMFRVEALRSTGLFDDGFFLYFEEVELMHRLRQNGWTVRHVPDSKIVHIEGASTGVGVSASALPPYWFKSRERYFALTGGRASIAAANIARLVGTAIGKAKSLGQRSKPRLNRIAEALWRRPHQMSPSFPNWGDAPGDLPAWMADE